MNSKVEKFYIPENVYIIGTMNDIDRSVDSFDFAMRRRFRFIEIKADSTTAMLDELSEDNKDSNVLDNDALKDEAMKRMDNLNKAIIGVDGLNENYQIGASYFLKLKTLTFNQLWEDYLRPLLQEYIQGLYNEDEIMTTFANAYGYNETAEGEADEEGVFIFPSAVKNTEDLSSDQMILQFINNKIHTGNVMGFLGYGTERLIIESRFSNNKNVDYFFRYLLERVLDLPNIVDLETNASREKQLYSL